METASPFNVPRQPRGAALAAAILAMTLLLLIGLVFMQGAMSESNIASNERNLVQAFYLAEAGLESGYRQLRVKMNLSKPTASDLAAVTPPSIANSTLASRFTLTLAAAQVGSNDYLTTIDRGAHRGLRGYSTDYAVTATASGPRGSQVILQQTTRYLRVPLFQFGYFYGKGVALSINTGPTFTFNGRIHANGNLHITDSCCGPSSYDSMMTAAGNFYLYRPDWPDRRYYWTVSQMLDGSGTYQRLDFDRNIRNLTQKNPPDAGGGVGVTWTEDSSLDYWKSESIRRFGGKLLDSAHGVEEITPPVPDLFNNPASPDVVAHKLVEAGNAADDAGLKANKLYYKADIVIKDGSIYTWNAGRTALNPVNTAACSAGTGLSQVTNFTDKREGKIITLRQVDVGKLTTCLGTVASGWNQTLYVHESAANTGVRLTNGGTLPSGGLTVVSENPVYVAGDYNKTNKQPAAILADAVTSLSNAWMSGNYDTKSNNVLSQRPAAATEQNFAMASGPNAEATPGFENGGGENAIRFLENWSGVSFKYRGSIIGLWHSMRATGNFIGPGTYYNPPNRDWGYDTLFDTQQPPNTPMGVVVTRGAWVKK